MHFTILHKTRYTYSRPVFLEPHKILLRPRCDATQELKNHDIQIHPVPAGLNQWRDGEGNDAVLAWFDGLTESLEITVKSEVSTLHNDPFDFIITDPKVQTLPAVYPEPLRSILEPCLTQKPLAPVSALADELMDECGKDTVSFLSTLTSRLYDHCEVVIREEGDPYSPDVTLTEKKGSCRDLAVAFNAVCRAVGLATRFVSGYQAGDADQERRYLHAWSEVYLPGGGWRGYDPTHGLAVSDQHVALAVSAIPSLAAPVQGSLRGTDATASMKVDLTIKRIE